MRTCSVLLLALLGGIGPLSRNLLASAPVQPAPSPSPAQGADESQQIAKSPVKLLREVEYIKRGDTSLFATIYVPPGDGPFPGVLMVHGGAWRGGSRWHMHRDAMQVALHDYTVVSISYRLAPKHPFPAQIEDCLAAVHWLRNEAKTYKIDATRVAGYGYSAGGHLVSLLGAMDPPNIDDSGARPNDLPNGRLQAVVAGGAPCNFTWIPENSGALAYWLGGSRKSKPEAYRRASPITFVSRDDPPMFFFHGALDTLVPPDSPARMRDRLKEVDVAAELHVIKEAGHVQAFVGQKAVPAAIEFLDRVLKRDAANEP